MKIAVNTRLLVHGKMDGIGWFTFETLKRIVDEQKNLEVFGGCSNPNWHGHNYELIVKIAGKINPETGFVMNLKDLSSILNQKIIDKVDHKNLVNDTE